jgi:hypothetical protein
MGNNGSVGGNPSATIITGDNVRQVIILQPSAGAYPQLDVMSVSINDGFTEGSGGGVAVWGGWCRLQWSDVQNNRSTLPGSGIFVQGGSLVRP